jgi:uncharacterized membrane-anchored protein
MDAGSGEGVPRLTPHPLRSAILGEVHARPFHPVTAPRRILHFAFITDAEQSRAAREALSDYCQQNGATPPAEDAKHFRAAFSTTVLRWESHAEFTTYTWEFPAQGYPAFDPPSAILAATMGQLPQPGLHLLSVDLHYIDGGIDPDLQIIFDSASLVVSTIDDGGSVVAMDFRPDTAGFVRILLRDLAMTPMRAGAVIQRLLEIETYRLLALLGLPEAQRLAPRIQTIEKQLTDVARQMTQSSGLDGDNKLLAELTGMLAELEAGSAQWNFRFGATRAYESIVQQRLNAIDEKTRDNWPSIALFLARRMAPAMRTVAMLDDRLTQLSGKLVRAANLLRTRVDVEIEQQNRDVLQSMNERTRLQLRLQQTVEGLSIAAVSYYIVGLLAYLFKGLKDAQLLPVAPEIAVALCVPLVVVLVAILVRRIRRRHIGS